MFKSILIRIVIPYILGILFFLQEYRLILGATAVALFLVYMIIYKRDSHIYILFLLLGVFVAFISFYSFKNKLKSIEDQKKYIGVVTKISLDSKSCIVKNNEYTFKLYFDNNKNLSVGDEIIFTGTVITDINYNKIFSKNINAYLKVIEFKKIGTKRNFFISLYKMSDNFKRNLIKIDKEAGAIINGFLSGDTEGLEEYTKDVLRELNLSHIVAVSGSHLGILALFTVILFSSNFKVRYFALLFFTYSYIVLANFSHSAVRAFIMILFVTLAQTLKKYPNSLNILVTTFIIMTATNVYIIYDIGFILSIVSTFGIIILTPVLKQKMDKRIAINLSAFIFSMPIILFLSGYVSIFSVITNLFVSYLVAFITIFSLITFIIFSLVKSQMILYAVLILGNLFIKLLNILKWININLYIPNYSLYMLFISYIIIILFFDLIKINDKFKKAILIVLSAVFLFNFYPKNQLIISFIDVGQGDSIFIETPNKKTILIDTGGNINGYNMAQNRVVPFIKKKGYRRIDVLIITHFHNDHAGGLQYVINNLQVQSKFAFKPNNKEFIELKNGDKLIVDGVELNILTNESETSENINENCLVIIGKYKEFDFLLTADAELSLMKKISGEFEIVKMPHHGSRYSFNEEILNNIKIQNSIFTVGRNNFNHPAKEVIDLLEENDIKYYRTDRDGTIQIRTDGEKYSINK
ncbi:MAG: internalization-related competence protein ComEC/Rec2 [Caloramator sp.]|jgi:competence protein ComEC|uniref:DNA internalization-related competence protein ComEC/Rec2 n=1 Tax=Caloramator sp. TaxID=1871330 RepID=UPI001DB15989|nr:DNA internalization-related competence protein ComEC/Rec2 [Caloramator sp.]MBZ4663151.1 internalization-related competence protein ComEC/Rec2 [Caloramator sp.]